MTSPLHTLLHYIRLCWNYILSNIFGHQHRNGDGAGIRLSTFFNRPKILTFDNGLQVEMGKQIAEGGFSYVFEAFPVKNNEQNTRAAAIVQQRSSSTLTSDAGECGDQYQNHSHIRKYALKRINCADHELVQSCRHEAGVHRSLPSGHPNLLELLGLKFDNSDGIGSSSSLGSASASSRSAGSRVSHKEYNVCYMLFPHIPHSLRGEITKRNILHDASSPYSRDGSRKPFGTKEILGMFGGLLDALTAMHEANISHRDVKLENILLQPRNYGDNHIIGGSSASGNYTPVLMDFGSAGPLTVQLSSRREALTVVEEAASHTTVSYRPQELFEGGVRHGSREVLNYGRVDVWSLGCVLFGLMHGASPFEMEFVRGRNDNGQYGLARIVECTHLKILGEVPFPPWAKGDNNVDGTGTNGKYPLSVYEFVRFMVNHDRSKRPDIHEVANMFEDLHSKIFGERWISYKDGARGNENGRGVQNFDDFDSLIASRDFV